MKKLIGLSVFISLFLVAGCNYAAQPADVPTDGTTPPPQSAQTETPATRPGEPDVVFNITGVDFAFSEKELTVNRGDTVKVIFTGTQGFHDWVITEFDAATSQVNPGEPTEVTFIADKAGTFEYFCSVGRHREMGMIGYLTVLEPAASTDMHMGCQEGEIDRDGKCVVADENNRSLFDKDVDALVTGTRVDTPELKGLLATPNEPGTYPGIVMIHEWWGLNANIEYMAKLLASEGYNVFAIDLYDGEAAETSERAGQLASAVRNAPDAAVAKMKAAVDYLKTNASAGRIASLGWCFGGQQSLNLSLNESLDATVIYYGQLTDDKERLKAVSGPVLGIFGERDQSISVESVSNFKQALDELGIQNDINIYPNVGHAFANPSNSNFAAEETVDAWRKTLAFLEENLK